MFPVEGGTVPSRCNTCQQETEHDVVKMEVIEDVEVPDSASTKFSVVVRCRGCKAFTIRRERWWFDMALPAAGEAPERRRIELIYSPPRTWQRPPTWLSDLQTQQPDLVELLGEVYSAANDEQFRLLAMGVRGAVDMVMNFRVGDVGTFDAKLTKMVEQKFITESQKETLAIVIDAASAAAHRGYKPPKAMLLEMLHLMEAMIREAFITSPLLTAMKQQIPPRPPRNRP